ELTTLYARKVLSPVDFIDAAVERAAKLQPSLNSFVLLDVDGARAAAQASGGRWLKGRPLSALDRGPTTKKDPTPVKGWPTRYGSHATDETAAVERAPIVDKFQTAGLFLLGKTQPP